MRERIGFAVAVFSAVLVGSVNYQTPAQADTVHFICVDVPNPGGHGTHRVCIPEDAQNIGSHPHKYFPCVIVKGQRGQCRMKDR